MEYMGLFMKLLSNNTYTQVISKFKAQPDTATRVQYILTVLENNNLMPKVCNHSRKCDKDSKDRRDVANQLYRGKKYVAALVLYNEALCHADVEGISLCFANRSAVYLALNLYDECLDNIRLAREAGYPAKLLPKLDEREAKCREAISKRSDKDVKRFVPELSYPASAEIPCMVDCIERVFNRKYGRHLVAKQDLKVGDIVILEKPYQVYLRNEYTYQKCTHCLEEKRFNLIPCPGCNKTMFCSKTCMEQAQKYHKTLCPIAYQIFEMESSNRFFALRILLTQLHDIGSVEALAATRASSMRKVQPETGDDGDEKARQRKELEALHALKHLNEPVSLGDSISFAIIFGCMMKHTDLGGRLVEVERQNLFLDLLSRYESICDLSAHGSVIMDRNMNNKMVEYACIGSNISFALSILNHSCASNTFVKSVNGSLTYAAIMRPVKKGEQLFCSYAAHHDHYPKKVRQKMIWDRYKFTCDCEACTRNYPMVVQLPKKMPPANFYENPVNSPQKMHLQMFNDCKKFYQKHAAKYPSRVLYEIWVTMFYSFGILSGNYSLNVCVD